MFDGFPVKKSEESGIPNSSAKLLILWHSNSLSTNLLIYFQDYFCWLTQSATSSKPSSNMAFCVAPVASPYSSSVFKAFSAS